MRALILSAGGCKGSYQAGALLHLSNLNLEFDIICGSSVGALNASFLAQYSKKDFIYACHDLNKFWNNLKQKQVYKRWFPFGKLHSLWEQSLYNSKPLQKLIDDNLDLEKLTNSGVLLRVGTVSVNSGQYKLYNHRAENIKKVVAASASFPPYFTPVKVNDELEFDAGLREYTPIKSAIDAGATEIYIICSETTNMDELYKPQNLNTLGVFKRFIETLAAEVIENDFNELQKINKKVLSGECKDKRYIKCHLIKPKEKLVEDSLDFDHKIITKLIQQGYNDAKEQVHK